MRRYPGRLYCVNGIYVITHKSPPDMLMNLRRMPLTDRVLHVPALSRTLPNTYDLTQKVRQHLRQFADCLTVDALCKLHSWADKYARNEQAMHYASPAHRVQLTQRSPTTEPRIGWNDYSPVTREVISAGHFLIQTEEGTMRISTSRMIPQAK